MENNKSREWLYNKFTAKGLNVGSYAQFDKALTDNEDSRKWAYNKAREFGYNVGADYDAFNAKINPTQQPTPQPTSDYGAMYGGAKPQAMQPIPPAPQVKAEVQIAKEQNTRDDVARMTEEVDEALNEAKGASARKYAEQTTEAAKGGFWKAIQNAMVNTAGAVSPTDMQVQTQQQVWRGGQDRELAKDIDNLEAAEHALENARRTINEADINAKNGTLVEKAQSTFVGGAARGFGQKLFDVRTWDMGVSDFKDQSAINDALDAAENGTLTESQEALLNAKAQEMAVQAYFGSYVGRGYKAGSVTAESLPFMLEMCINPASTLGKSAASRLARYAINKYGKQAAKKVGAKVLRAGARVAGDVAGAATMTATTGSIRTAADALDRMSGGVTFDTDEAGHAVFAGRYERPEDAATAFRKAFAATTIENFSEMLGNYFGPALDMAGNALAPIAKLVDKGVAKITPRAVSEFIEKVSASDLAKMVKKFEELSNWNGTIDEFNEELAGGILNALIVGDQTLDADPETGVFNLNNAIDTFLGVGLMGWALSSAKAVGYPVQKYQANRAMKNADVNAVNAFGDLNTWEKIKTDVTAAQGEDRAVVIGSVLSDPNVTEDQKVAMLQYVSALQRKEGVTIGEQKRRENPDVPQEQVEVEQSFDNGAALETPQEKNDAQNMFEYQQQQMRQYFGLGEDGDVDAFLGDDPIAGLQRVSANDQEAGQVILDYLNAKATVDGVFQRMSDDAEAKIAEADAIIASRTNRNNGLIQRVRLKNDKQAYVLSGDIVMTDDGDMVNVSKSSESLVVIDAITGKKEYTYPSNIAEVYQSVDAETERQTLREQVIDEYSQKLADDMNGTLAFAPGDNYTLVDDQGAQHNVQIVADNGDGTVAVVEVMPDGVQQEAVMAKSTIQEMSGTYNQLRLGQYLQDKKAQEIAIAEQEAQAEQSEVVAEEQPQVVSALSQVPTDEKGKHDFNQVTPDIAWNAIVEMNEGSVEDALDTAKQMQKQSNDALKAAQKEKPKVGTDVESIIANKNAHKEKINGLQAIADHWANIVALGEQSAQQNELTEEAVAENVVVEETAPVAEQTEVSPEVAPVAEEVVEPVAEVAEQTPIAEEQMEVVAEQPTEVVAEQTVEETPAGEKEESPVEEAKPTTPAKPKLNISEKENKRRIPLRRRANLWGRKVGVKVVLLESIDEVESKEAQSAIREAEKNNQKVSGWVDEGKVYLYLPHVSNTDEIDATYIHEVVAHIGMEELMGEKEYQQFCLKVWDMMNEQERDYYYNYEGVRDNKNEEKRKARAADEYIAHLAEQTNLEERDATMWEKIVDLFTELLAKLGYPKNISRLNIEDAIRESYRNLVESNVIIEDQSGAVSRLANKGAVVDAKRGDVKFAVRDILKGEEREQAIKDLMRVTGRSRKTVLNYLKAEESLARIILNEDNVAFLDLQVDESVPSIWENSDYPQGTVEFSNICRKRLPFTMIYQRLQGEFPNTVFDAATLETIRGVLKENGVDVACGLCFVEDRRQLLGEIGQGFIDAINGKNEDVSKAQGEALAALKESGDTYVPTLYDLLTLDGMKVLRKEHPDVALAFIKYNNARGMQAGRLFQAYSAYHRDILGFTKQRVEKINNSGGLRIFSYSDFEAHHLIDLVQVLTDCSRMGIKVQGYTKVPEFARAVKDTKMKLNRSLIAKGNGVVDADYVPQKGEAVSPNVINGKRLLLDTVEGIDVNHKDFFDSSQSANVGNIIVGISDEHIKHAMLDPFVDYIIPFHSGIKEETLKQKGIGEWRNYKLEQLEKIVNDKGKLVNADKHGINIYTEVLSDDIKTEKQFVEKYLDVCREKGWIPKFHRLLNTDKDGNFVYTKGYYKLLLDYKLFDQKGNILPQEVVSPIFDPAFNERILNEYVEGEKTKAPNEEVYNKVKEALSERGTIRYRFIGEKGAANLDKAEEATIRLDNLNTARQMEETQKSPKTIKMATGWERGADDKWRYEENDTVTAKTIRSLKGAGVKKIREARSQRIKQLDKFAYITHIVGVDQLFDEEKILATSWSEEQKKMWLDIYNMFKDDREGAVEYERKARAEIATLTSFGQGQFMLYEVLGENDSIFKAYPEMRNVKFWLKPYKGGKTFGGYNRLNNTIEVVDFRGLFENDKGEGSASTAAHEIQHIIQGYEGFARGGNMSMLDPNKENAKDTLVASMTEKFNESMAERDALWEQKQELDRQMENWWLDHTDATSEDMNNDPQMREWNKQYDEIIKKHNEAVKNVEFFKDRLVGAEEMDVTLGEDGYKRLAGEVEARNVERRRNMSMMERRNSPAWETEDVARKDQIFISDALESEKAYAIGNNEQTQSLNAKQKNPSQEEVVDERDIQFRISKNNRTTINGWMNKRSDLTEADKGAFLDYINDLDSKTQLATGKWFANGVIRVPEDMPKVEQAIKVATIAKVDPLQYKSPMELIDRHADIKVKEKPIDPDTVDTLYDRHVVGDTGIVTYEVEESEESRENMRKIINTHFGDEASPWCLLQGDGKGNLTPESAEYWEHYSAYPKRVAFKDGKLLAFSANSEDEVVWWDRQDEAHEGIPVVDKIDGDELGRSAEIEYDETNGEVINVGQYFKGNKQNGTYERWSLHDDNILIERSTYKDGKRNGLTEMWSYEGHPESKVNFKDGERDGESITYAPSGKIVQKVHYKNGLRHGTWETWNGYSGLRTRFANYTDGALNGHYERWHSNGRLAERGMMIYDQKDGLWEEWDEQGRLTSRTNYNDGLREGLCEIWTNGILRVKALYKGGKLAKDLLEEESNSTPRFRIAKSAEEFDATQKEAVEKRGIVVSGLNDAIVNVIEVPRHDFTGTGKDAIKKAEIWANENIAKEHTYHKGLDDEFNYTIDDEAISKFLSKSSTGGSENLGVHLAVLKELPNVIDNSIEVEIHADYQKKDGVRSAENGIGRRDMLVHRMYGAVSIDGKEYRTKTTVHEYRDKENRAYDYKITEVELIISGSSTSNALNNSTSVDAAKLLKGVEKSYDKGKKVLDESEKELNTRFRITPAMDKAYMDAVERGDMDEAQKMVNVVASAAGYSNDESWKKSHRAPRKSEDDVNPFNTEELVPDDYWTHPEWYTNMRNSADRESYYNMVNAIRKYKRLVAEGKQEEADKVTVTMYRGVDKTANKREGSFRNGDWITPSRSYAKLSAPYGKSRVIEQEVPLKYIWWDGNSINEWGYDDGANYTYKDTKNNRKLLNAVTYDDNGNVIPLSQRFNSRESDIRFRVTSAEANQRAYNLVREKLQNAGIKVHEVSEEMVDGAVPLQTPDGTIYGWAVGGEIYLTPDGLNANTAIHEYSHLWVEAMRQKNPRKWSEIKEQLKATPFWQQVLDDPNYANIRENEDAVASEVLARLSGNKGAERLATEAQRILDAGNGSLMARIESSALVQHVKRLLRDFYAWVSRNIFGVTNEATISQFSDMVVDDLLDEVALDNIEESPYEAMVGNKQEDTDDGVRYRSDVDEVFDVDFAELESEYQQLDKNDEQAMAEWRAKKKQVVEDYLGYMTEQYDLPCSVFVFDHNNEQLARQAFDLVIDGFAANSLYWRFVRRFDYENQFRAFVDHYINSDSRGGRIPGHDIAIYNIGNGIELNRKEDWLNTLLHENTHAIEQKLGISNQEFRNVWGEFKQNGKPSAVARFTKNYKTDRKRGNELLAYSVGDFIKPENVELFDSFMNGEATVDEILKFYNDSLPLRNDYVRTILNELQNGRKYKAEDAGTSRQGGDNARGSETSRQDSQTPERESGRYVRGDNAEGYGQFGYNLNAIATAAEELAGQLHTPIRIIGDVSEINDDDLNTRRRKRSYKGWYDVSTGEVVVVAPNATSVADVQRTVIHEVVAHNGLRELFGADFDTFLDNVYRNVDEPIRRAITDLAARKGWKFRVATEEYLASLAETTNFEEIEKQGWWQKIKDYFMDLLRKVGIKLAKPLTNDELRYILWRSYQMQTSKGAMAAAEDVDMQRKLGVGNFRTQQAAARLAEILNNFTLTERNDSDFAYALMKSIAGQRYSARADYAVLNGVEIRVKEHTPNWDNFLDWETDTAKYAKILNVTVGDYNSLDYYKDKSEYEEFVKEHPETAAVDVFIEDGTTLEDALAQIHSALKDRGIDFEFMPNYDWVDLYSEDENDLSNRLRAREGSGSFAKPNAGVARDIYNEKVRTPKTDTKRWDKEYWSVNTVHRLHEAYVDSMAGLKTLQEAILKETGNEIHSYEDAYKAENRMSSENKAQAEIYMRDFFQPLMDEVGKLSAKGATLDDIKMYLIAKHGLERNVIFSQRAAAERGEEWDGTIEDYSGLTDLTGEDKDFQAAAQHLVQDFEAGYDTKPLWDKINAATKESLRINYESGLMSKETYDKVRTMFAYYVPLRGWDRNVAADEYEYLTSNRPMLSPTLKTAKGRKSLADDPIATIGYMAESAIIQGNRNLMKQKFLNFVLNNPTSLATVSEQWYVRSGDEWVPSTPDIPADATADEVDAIVKAHEQKMEALGDDATKKRDGLKIGLHTTAREGQEHVIRVKRAGKEYCIYINGNPIAAQAINGLTNPNTDQNAFEEVAQGVKNLMARAFTSQNPAFIVTNLSRDVIWAGTAVAVKEDKAYAAQYTKNVTKILATFKLPVLLRKFQNGTLDMNNDIERYFAEFIRNGGETGFTQINTVEDYKRDIERMVKDAKGETSKLRKAWQATWGGIEFLNRSAEDITRFSVYMTSRQMGRDVARSVWDAKEITVNFNKKGRGTFGASMMNFAYIFFNASIQGLANFGRLMYHHPKKMTLALSTFASAGMIAPMFSILLSALLGDDDDNYWDLPEWVRRNNIVLFNPFSERGFFTIPLPHELRPFYGMGELFISVMMGKESVEDALGKAARGFADLLPIDVTGNGGNMAINLAPTVAQPVAQLIANTDYFGVPIYRRNDYNELDPDWTKAYKGTNPFLVESAKWLNEVTGGDNVVKGKADINPAIVEHLFESYLGGMGKTFNKTVTTFSMLFNKDAREWRNVPVLSSFYQVPNDRTSGSQVNREYFEARDEAKEIEHQFSGYKKQLRMGAMEYAEKLDELMKSPIFARYRLIKGYDKAITNLNAVLKLTDDPTNREKIETAIMELKAKMLAELETLDAQTDEDAGK